MQLVDGRWVDVNAKSAGPPDVVVSGSEYRTVDPNRWLVIALVLALVALAGLGGSLYVEHRPTVQERAAGQLVEDYYAALNRHDEAAVMTLMAPTGSHTGNGALGGDVLPVSGRQLRTFLHQLLGSGAFAAELTGPAVVTPGPHGTVVSVPNRLSARLPDGRTVSVTGVSLLSLVTVDGRLRVDKHAWWEQGSLGWSQWTGATVTPVKTCPAGSTPDRPGPATQSRPSQSRPKSDPQWGMQAAMDQRAGRLVAVAFPETEEFPTYGGGTLIGETWTFDVCTNTWTRMRPAGEPPLGFRVRLVYDAYTDLTVAFPAGYFDPDNGMTEIAVSTYSLPTNTWTPLQPITAPDGFRGFTDVVDDPLSGQVFLFSAETGDLWAYQVQTNTMTAVDQGATVPPDIISSEGQLVMRDRSTLQLSIFDPTTNAWKTASPATDLGWMMRNSQLSYDPVADRLVLTLAAPVNLAAAGQTWVFDPQAHTWTHQHAVPPGVLAWGTSFGTATFDTAAGRTVAFSDGVLSTYDTATDEWTSVRSGPGWPTLTYLDGMPTGPLARRGPTFAYDPVNRRGLLVGGLTTTSTGDPQTPDDVWAYTLATNTWTQILPGTTDP
jgi:hypothetical protein